MQGTKTLENLGYDAVERKLKFSSSMEDFKIINADTQVFTVNQNYLKYMQECIESGSFNPIEGSLQISSKADKSTILSFESSGCSS